MHLIANIITAALYDLAFQETRQDAIEWLTDYEATECDAFTVPWICTVLGLDVDVARKGIEECIALPPDVIGTRVRKMCVLARRGMKGKTPNEKPLPIQICKTKTGKWRQGA